jgi:hypothetical protein
MRLNIDILNLILMILIHLGFLKINMTESPRKNIFEIYRSLFT